MRKGVYYIFVLPMILLTACGDDDSNHELLDYGEVVVKDDGTTSDGSVFSVIDDQHFYLDYIKYTVLTDSTLSVSDYDKNNFYFDTKIASKVVYKGNTYKTLYIRANAFYNCLYLRNITIPKDIKRINDRAFSGCAKLESISIPDSVVYIGESVFYGCSGLKSIFVNPGNKIYDSRYNCNAIIKKEEISIGIDNLPITGSKLVTGCKNTIIPPDVRFIGNSAFGGCTGLTSIDIPTNVVHIGSYAFSGCTGLEKVVLPKKLTKIGASAFKNCISLTSIHLESDTPLEINTPIFDNDIYSRATLYVPVGSLELYKQTAPWKWFEKIVEE